MSAAAASSPARVQAIPGVSASEENTIATWYPSVGADGIGRLMSTVLNSIPIPLWPLKRVKLSHLLFGPLLIPIAAPWYLVTKVFGNKYLLTNRRLQIRTAVPLLMGDRLIEEVTLGDIAAIEIEQSDSQRKLDCGDLKILDAKGDVILTLAGIGQPAVSRRNILEARDARQSVEASLAHIRSR